MITTWSEIKIPATVAELKDKTSWDKLVFLASSRPMSYDLDRTGTFKTKSWLFTDTDIQYVITQDDVIEGSLNVTLASRSEIVNKVTINFDYRFPQLCERRHFYSWQHDGVCSTSPYPTIDMITQACTSTGARLDYFDHTNVYPDGLYTCNGSPMIFMYLDTDRSLAVSHAELVLSRRFSRDVRRNNVLTVLNQVSIDNIGELEQNESQSLEVTDFDINKWETDYTMAPYPNNAANNSSGTYYYNYDTKLKLDVDYAMEFYIDKAKVTILNSHRKNHITFTLPYETHLNIDRNDFVHVNINQPFTGYPSGGFDKVLAKGQVVKIVETFYTQNGSAVKEVTVAVMRIEVVGLPQEVETATVVPTATTSTTEHTGSQYIFQLESWYSNGDPARYPTDTSYGLIADLPGISDTPIIDATTGQPTGDFQRVWAFPKEFRIPSFEISEADQAEIVEPYTTSYAVEIPVKQLEVSL